MTTVSIHGINIHANLGLYPEEKLVGNDFVVDIDVQLNNKQNEEQFVDYVVLHQISKEVFAKGFPLLEELAKAIHDTILQRYSFAGDVRVCIKKMQPPIVGQVAYAQVCYSGH